LALIIGSLVRLGLSEYLQETTFIVATLAGSSFGTLYALWAIRDMKVRNHIFPYLVSWKKFFSEIVRRKDYILYNLPTSMLHKGRDTLVVIAMALYYGHTAVAVYAVYHAIITLPAGILASVIRRDYLIEISNARSQHTLITRRLAFGLILFCVLAAYAALTVIVISKIMGPSWMPIPEQILYSIIFSWILIMEIESTSSYLYKSRQAIYLGLKLCLTALLSITLFAIGSLTSLENFYLANLIIILLTYLVIRSRA
jgi:hypothetical protein